MTDPVALIGDIHGSADTLRRLLASLPSDDSRRLVFLGDYVNRGRSSREVLETLITLREQRDCTFLLGNHDYALLGFLDNGDFVKFGSMGGMWTLRSYLGDELRPDVVAQFRESFPESHRTFLENLDLFWSSRGLFASHAGLNPRNPSDRSLETVALHSHPELFHMTESPFDDLIVAGHYVQRSAVPYDSEHFVCLDTGCGSMPSGRLTAFFWPEHSFLTVDPFQHPT